MPGAFRCVPLLLAAITSSGCSVIFSADEHAGGSAPASGGAAGLGGAAGSGGAGAAANACCDFGPIAPIFHSTLDDASAIESPKAGSGIGSVLVSNKTDQERFPPGMCGNGLWLDQPGELFTVPEADPNGKPNIEYDVGVIAFWYKPDAAHTDPAGISFFTSTQFEPQGGLRLRKFATGELLAAAVSADQTQQARSEIAPTAYSFAQGAWVHVAVSWNFSNPVGQSIRVALNGVQIQDYTTAQKVTMTMPASVHGRQFGFQWSEVLETVVNGVIDEVRIYDSIVTTFPPGCTP